MKLELLERLRRLARLGRGIREGVEAGAPAQKARMFTCKPIICRAFCVLPLPSVARDRASELKNVRSRGAVWLDRKRL